MEKVNSQASIAEELNLYSFHTVETVQVPAPYRQPSPVFGIDAKIRDTCLTINDPRALRQRTIQEIPAICNTLRQQLITSVSDSGGHFAAGLGVVELTVALHYVFNTPEDRLIWDVGHQTYPHKMLTGRRQDMSTIRSFGGLSGFPTREESQFDAFGVAHAGTSISAALGMAIAAARATTDKKVVAIIGDGALTEGMAFEALNHAGGINEDLLVILNDNNMSISPNVGALSGNDNTDSRSKKGFFEALGAHYDGPIDGHDARGLITKLQQLNGVSGLKVLHVLTKKGKGYQPAELNPVKYHAVAPFDPAVGMQSSVKKASLTYTQVFGQWLCDTAEVDERVMAITPAMREGSGLVEFEQRFPERYFDVGIAEQHAVTLAAGMACENYKPVVAIYSSFLQRAYDQVVHDVALQKLNVLFALDRSGLVGADGATHHGSLDMSFLRSIPNMVLMAPSNEPECRAMLQTGLEYEGPAAVRYERGTGPGAAVNCTLESLELGRASVERTGESVALLAFGSMLESAYAVADSINATVVNMRFIKPMDDALLKLLSDEHQLFVTLENNAVTGGAGSAVNERMNALKLCVPTLNLGLPDQFVSHGSQEELLESIDLHPAGILESIVHYLDETAIASDR